MTSFVNSPVRFVGCDVGKENIVVFDSRDGTTKTVPNKTKALQAFVTKLDRTCLIICEATGGYEQILLQAAVLAEVPIHRADARKVKAFIRSFGTLGKTDAIDAQALANYGRERSASLTLWQAPEPHQASMQALVLLRRDLVATRQAYQNRASAPGAQTIKRHLEAQRKFLDKQIKAIEDQIAKLVRDTPKLASAAATLRSIVGIGATSAAALIALMPELGHLNRHQAAALAGLAPHPRQSGGFEGYRRTQGGRPEVRRVVFMAALVASRHNDTMATFYKRLIANGKKPIVAITAVMRKLIVLCNALLRDANQNPVDPAKQVSVTAK